MAYTVNEVFYSPQGEGMRAGQMSVFVRFTGCNLKCSKEAGEKSIGGFDCDTEFASGRRMTAEDILAACFDAMKSGGLRSDYKPCADHRPWIVLTGGEPALQVDAELLEVLHGAGFMCAIETNGSIDLADLRLDWITVSPKVAEHCVRQLKADEVKYVRGHGQAIPKPVCKARHQLISPAFDGLALDRRAFDWCLRLIKENPEWRMSVQMHKAWMVR